VVDWPTHRISSFYAPLPAGLFFTRPFGGALCGERVWPTIKERVAMGSVTRAVLRPVEH
jgi:hypothetical protein